MLKTIPVFDPIEGMSILEQKVGTGKNAINFGTIYIENKWIEFLKLKYSGSFFFFLF